MYTYTSDENEKKFTGTPCHLVVVRSLVQPAVAQAIAEQIVPAVQSHREHNSRHMITDLLDNQRRTA